MRWRRRWGRRRIVAVVTYVSLLPTEIEERLKRFLAEGCTGSIELHVNNGSISGFKVIESGRVNGAGRTTGKSLAS